MSFNQRSEGARLKAVVGDLGLECVVVVMVVAGVFSFVLALMFR